MKEKIVKYIENLFVTNRDFEYTISIDSDLYNEFDIQTINIDIFYNNQKFNTQPILYGTNENLKKLSLSLWNEISNDWNDKPIKDKSCYSLKNNVLITELAKIIENKNLGKVLDIGSYNGEILYLLNQLETFEIEEYIGVDIIHKENICLYTISNKQEYIEEDINLYLKKSQQFDTVLLSMTLLNIIDLDEFFIALNNVCNINTKIYIVDINSQAYQATGFYYKKDDEWFLKNIYKANEMFFTLKKLSKNYHTIHCHHPFNLYREKLELYNFKIEYDYVKGANVEDIINSCENEEYRKKMIKKMSKYTKYPCFHL